MPKGFAPPKPLLRRSYMVEFKRRYSDGSELDLWWWRINIPKLNSSATEEEVAKVVIQTALHSFQRLNIIRKPNLIYLLTADGGDTLGEGFLGELENGELVAPTPILATIVKQKIRKTL